MTTKQKIASVLLDANNNLTSEDIKWAMSYLPDANQIGEFKTPIIFNHSEKSIEKASGLEVKDLHDFTLVMNEAIVNSKRVSEAVEKVFNKLGHNDKFVISMIINTVNGALDKLKKMDEDTTEELKRFLDLLKKKRKRDDDDGVEDI